MVRISDIKLIKLLMDNARTPYTKLADELGVSEGAVRKRIKVLEKRGIIRKFTVDVDPKTLGYKLDTLIGVDTTPEKYLSIVEELRRMKEIVELYTSAGDHMLMFRMWFKDSEDLNKFINSLGKMDGVTRVCPAILLEKLR